MGQRRPITSEEKEQIYRGKLAGKTLAAVAGEVDCSRECARKWWRVGCKRGIEGLRDKRRARGKKGCLSHFAAEVGATAVDLKRGHPGWGAQRVKVELQADPRLAGLAIPGCSRLATWFKEQCPGCVQPRHPRPRPSPPPSKVGSVHEVWQVDSQEKIVLNNGEIATLCNIRDPVGAAMIASRGFSVKQGKCWRKLEWKEVRGVIRQGMTEWGTMPDIVQTDNELRLAGGPSDPFPSQLTLWLAGLGIAHRFIRPGHPTDQPQIERNHRTLDNWALSPHALTDLEHLQLALDDERARYHQAFPSQASQCAGHPPLQAYPELLHPRRPYQPDQELILFDIQRVYDFLATFTFRRKPNNTANVSLGRHFYCMGAKRVRQLHLSTVLAQLDPLTRQWIFLTDETQPQKFLRLPLRGLDTFSLTDLTPAPIHLAAPIQLTLPLGFSLTRGTITIDLLRYD